MLVVVVIIVRWPLCCCGSSSSSSSFSLSQLSVLSLALPHNTQPESRRHKMDRYFVLSLRVCWRRSALCAGDLLRALLNPPSDVTMPNISKWKSRRRPSRVQPQTEVSLLAQQCMLRREKRAPSDSGHRARNIRRLTLEPEADIISAENSCRCRRRHSQPGNDISIGGYEESEPRPSSDKV